MTTFEVVSFAAVSWGGALRDDPNNGCEGDYIWGCHNNFQEVVFFKQQLFALETPY